MSKIAFVQTLDFPYLGTMYLSSVLKKGGHSAECFIFGQAKSTWKKNMASLMGFKPDIIGFSCTTGMHKTVLELAREIKKMIPGAVTILGGPHPTFFPEVINEEGVDMICIGEGEQSLLELADSINDSGKIANLHVKNKGGITRNGVRKLVENLDEIPFPDRSIYFEKYGHLRTTQKVFMAGRGCPYNCTYCFNHSLKKIYEGKGAYVRMRSPGNIIEEIVKTVKSEKTNTVYFQDDVFAMNKEWLKEFAASYKKTVNLPFVCLLRVEYSDEQVISTLKSAGCKNVFFGIETGSETLRKELLGRRMPDEQIKRTAGLLKKYGIGFRTYNMLGLPGETLSDAMLTVKINQDIKTDYPWCSLFYPYPGTELGEYAKREGYLLDERPGSPEDRSFFKTSIVKSSNRRQVINLQKLFLYAVKFPAFMPVIKLLIRLPQNILFDLAFLAGYAWSYMKSENFTPWEVFVRGVKNVRKFYF